MNVDTAQKILGINWPFTEEELKAAYRKKSKQYHPDLHSGDSFAAERMIEINAANDLLIDTYFPKKAQEKPSHNDIIDNFIAYTHFDIDKSDNSTVAQKYQTMIYKYAGEFATKIQYFTQSDAVNIQLGIYKGYVVSALRNFAKEYFLENMIDNEYLKSLRYDCSVQEFYNKLLENKIKYGKKYLFNQKIEQLISGYKDSIFFLKISQYVNSVVKKVDNVELMKIADLDEYISNLQREIIRLFSNIDNLIKTINYLNSCLYHLYEYSQLSCALDLLQRGMDNTYIQNTTGVNNEDVQLYDSLLKVAQVYKGGNWDLDYNWNISSYFSEESLFNLIYRVVVSEYSKALITNSRDIEKTKHLNELWSNLSLMLIGNRGKLDIDILLAISSISFDDLENANNIINETFLQMDIYFDFKSHYLKVIYNNIVYVIGKNNVIRKGEIKLFSLGKRFDYLIDNSTFIGKVFRSGRAKNYIKLWKYRSDSYDTLNFYIDENGNAQISAKNIEESYDIYNEYNGNISKEDFMWGLKKQLLERIIAYEESLKVETDGPKRA